MSITEIENYISMRSRYKSLYEPEEVDLFLQKPNRFKLKFSSFDPWAGRGGLGQEVEMFGAQIEFVLRQAQETIGIVRNRGRTRSTIVWAEFNEDRNDLIAFIGSLLR